MLLFLAWKECITATAHRKRQLITNNPLPEVSRRRRQVQDRIFGWRFSANAILLSWREVTTTTTTWTGSNVKDDRKRSRVCMLACVLARDCIISFVINLARRTDAHCELLVVAKSERAWNLCAVLSRNFVGFVVEICWSWGKDACDNSAWKQF